MNQTNRRIMSASWMASALLSVAAAAPAVPDLRSAVVTPDGRAMAWVSLETGSDPVAIGRHLKAKRVQVMQLAPEGRLLVAVPKGAAAELGAVPGTADLKPAVVAEDMQAGEAAGAVRGMGDREPGPGELDRIRQLLVADDKVDANDLSRARAMLDGIGGLPTGVDNSLSQYFPPIRSQGNQGSCTAWATCYYYNTYTQARDGGLLVSDGNNDFINSPAFMYPLVNGGQDGGAVTSEVMARLNEVGCCSWTAKPYTDTDYTSWPGEAAWVEALRNRCQSARALDGSTATGLEAIKQHLANGNLAVTRFTVYATWDNEYPANATGIDNGVYYAPDGGSRGGHAVTIVGYDDNRTYRDHRSGQTKAGALLIANSWGTGWGTFNSTGAGTKGFFWVAYGMFTERTFGPYAYFNTDREDYSPRLYATCGLDHVQRDKVAIRGGVGGAAAPAWTSYAPISYAGGGSIAITADRRVAVDLTDGLAFAGADPRASTWHVRASVAAGAGTAGTLAAAGLHHDFDGDGVFARVPSADPPLLIQPGQSAAAEVPLSPTARLQIANLRVVESSGNNDQICNPGQTMAVRFHIVNTGLGAAPDATAELLAPAGDPAFTVLSGAIPLGSIAAGGQADPAGAFLVQVSRGVDTPHEGSFRISVRDAAGNAWSSGFGLTVNTSALVSGRVRLLAAPHAPVAGATVAYEGAGSGRVTAGADGFYQFTAVDGSCLLTAAAAGLATPRAVEVVVTSGSGPQMMDLFVGSPTTARTAWSGPIAMPGGGSTWGPADPYPSTVTASGVDGMVVGIKVKLEGFSHTWPSDVDVVLEGPGGHAVKLLGGVGGSADASNANLAFVSGTSAPQVPTPIVSGTYLPTSRVDDSLPGAPAAPYGDLLNVFLGADPNGSWRLYAYDWAGGDAGSLRRWCVEFEVAAAPDSFEVWSLLEFGVANPAGALHGDPDGDRLDNLLEYALGLNPRRASVGGGPQLEFASVQGATAAVVVGERHLGLRVERACRRPDLDYLIEVSPDLANWFSGPGQTVVAVDDETELYAYDLTPVSAAPRRFMRLRVERR